MKKLISLVLIALLALSMIPAQAQNPGVVNVFNWEDYINDEVIAGNTRLKERNKTELRHLQDAHKGDDDAVCVVGVRGFFDELGEGGSRRVL